MWVELKLSFLKHHKRKKCVNKKKKWVQNSNTRWNNETLGGGNFINYWVIRTWTWVASVVGIYKGGHALGDSFFGDTTFYENLSRSFQNRVALPTTLPTQFMKIMELQRPCQKYMYYGYVAFFFWNKMKNGYGCFFSPPKKKRCIIFIFIFIFIFCAPIRFFFCMQVIKVTMHK